MTIMIKDVGWGSFSGYEGAHYSGTQKVLLPSNATFDQKALYVVASSEGNFDSISMVDRAIISVGAIQWVELNQYSVSNMIGYVAETCGIELVEQKLHPALLMSKATFKKTPQGRWRFHIPHPTTGEEVVVETEALSRWMYARGSGKVGTWPETNKLWAKCWAASIADLFQDPTACEAQVEWTVPQLQSNFVWQQGKAIVFEAGSSYEGYAGVVKTILICYAVNLPAVAEKIIAAAAARSPFPKWSKQWCLDLMHDLALTSGVSIWPGRYNANRPALEAAFGVQLPKTANELALRAWATQPVEVLPPPSVVVETPIEEPVVPSTFIDVEDVFVKPERPALPSAPGFWGTLQNFSNTILSKLGRK